MQCADVDYASTMWRPDLQPLPRRKKVLQITGADGLRNYAVLEAVPPGTVLEISLCLKVPVVAVDQFPFLSDFVLTGETQNVHAMVVNRPVPPRTHTAIVFLQSKMKEKSEDTLNGCCISSLHSPSSNAQPRNHSNPSRPLNLVSFLRMDQKYECKGTDRSSVPSGPHALQQCPRPQFDIDSGIMHV